MTQFVIPLQNVPQVFSISLANIEYILTSKWNSAPDGGWVMDISDASTNIILACNIPLITGANVLEGLQYLGINGIMVVYTDGNDFAVPILDNLGVESNLYFFTDVVLNG